MYFTLLSLKNMNLKTKVWSNIKKLRKERNISQEELAQKVWVKRPYLSKLENGWINVTVDTLEKIAFALDVEIIYLFS